MTDSEATTDPAPDVVDDHDDHDDDTIEPGRSSQTAAESPDTEPAFDIDMDPEDQGTAEAAPEPTG